MSRQPKLQRRTFLQGLGTTMALPLLDAMGSSAYAAPEPTAPNRLAFVFFPNGAIMDRWKPKVTDDGFELNSSMEPLQSVKDDLLIFSGLTQHHGRANGDGGGDHARNAGSFLTGAQPRKTSGADIRVGQSIDQAIAAQIGKQTRLPSIELGIARGRNAGNCDSGYSCAYSNNISWKTATTPTAKEINPRLAFERLFGTPEDANRRKQRAATRKSVLDFVADDAQRLRTKLGQTDRRKMDEYYSSVREIEQRIARAATKAIEVPEYDMPAGMPKQFEDHVKLMYDIMLLAFQTDATRVATFMVHNAGSNISYPQVNVKGGHHQLSHHGNDESKMERIARIDKFLVTQFAYFLEQLKKTNEGEGNLLDNSMILYGSAISDANRHNHHDLPVIVAGHGGGTLKPGRYIQNENETPLNNLFLSLGDRVGAKIEKIGDSTGRLDLG